MDVSTVQAHFIGHTSKAQGLDWCADVNMPEKKVYSWSHRRESYLEWLTSSVSLP